MPYSCLLEIQQFFLVIYEILILDHDQRNSMVHSSEHFPVRQSNHDQWITTHSVVCLLLNLSLVELITFGKAIVSHTFSCTNKCGIRKNGQILAEEPWALV
ncbi:unnamed protein product [Schistosoma bovis]|nr:unnamed protein product [Schistosoma bovis]